MNCLQPPQQSQVIPGRLQGLNGKDYAAYQSLLGNYTYPLFDLIIEQIPKDPYAPPHTGVYRLRVAWSETGLSPSELTASHIRSVAARDYIARRFFTESRRVCPVHRGTGFSGVITLSEPGQEILDRSSVAFDDEAVEIRFFIGLPARGRSIDATTATTMLLDELPEIVKASLMAETLDREVLDCHIAVAEDYSAIQQQLDVQNLVAFIANGAVLPRTSGVDQRPLDLNAAIPFISPESLQIELSLPHAGRIQGMGLAHGITLIVGGGYHGKSTLLRAIERCVYPHIPGDGRELCASLPSSVKVRAEEGRSVIDCDISAFISNLPQATDTTAFSTENASGSTSQAAAITEAVEAGARVLLMDEDSCAANLMIRDARMQKLVARDDEPITAYVDRVRELYDELGVSTVLIMGGSGDYFDVANRVIHMVAYLPEDVTGDAAIVATDLPTFRSAEAATPLAPPRERHPLPDGLVEQNEYGYWRIYASRTDRLIYGSTEVDLGGIDQLVEPSQTKAIGLAMEYAKQFMDGNRTLRKVIDRVRADMDRHGLDLLDRRGIGDIIEFRSVDLAAVINRFRGMTFT